MIKYDYTTGYIESAGLKLGQFASDSNCCKTREEAVDFMKKYEEECAKIISRYLTENNYAEKDFNYFIIGNKNNVVIAMKTSYDNAILATEALVKASPYYSVVDLFCEFGLQAHCLKKDFKDTTTTNKLLND